MKLRSVEPSSIPGALPTNWGNEPIAGRFDGAKLSVVIPLPVKGDSLTEQIIGAAIEVHKDKGPGLVESIYEWCLLRELELRQLSTQTQRSVLIRYKRFSREDPLRFDVCVEGRVMVEVKSVERILAIHQAQLLSYMKLLNVPVGLLINFNVTKLIEGVIRLELPTATYTEERSEIKNDFVPLSSAPPRINLL